MRLNAAVALALLGIWIGMSAAQSSDEDTHKIINDAMRSALVGKMRLDGQAVTNIEEAGSCATSFTTATGATVIEWSKISNPSVRSVDGQTAMQIRSGETVNDLLMSPDIAESAESAMTVLYGDCQPPN